MSNSYFQFKHFRIQQEKASHKVGADGVTLGAWCHIPEHTHHILDIGTGTGLLALMMAQRCTQAHITAIEIDQDSYQQAVENIQHSLWNERITVIHSSIQEWTEQTKKQFDLIVSNPPYFDHALKANNTSRSNARHTDTLSKEALIHSVCQLLHPNGRLALILPPTEHQKLKEIAEAHQLHCVRATSLYPNSTKPTKRILTEWSKTPQQTIHNQLIIERERHHYTDSYSEMVQDFYLHL